MLKTHLYAGLAASFLLATISASAQDTTSCTAYPQIGMGWLSLPNKVAFYAKVKESSEQKLADGNVIRQEARFVQATDSAGRNMQQYPVACERTQDHQTSMRYTHLVFDSKLRTTLRWQTGGNADNSAELIHSGVAHRQNAFATIRPAQLVPYSPPTKENLGQKDIDGFATTGFRMTTITPAGAMGNEMPIIRTDETWKTADGVTLLHIRDSPFTGHQVTQVEELRLGDPDPALFSPPSGYTVRDDHPELDKAADASTANKP